MSDSWSQERLARDEVKRRLTRVSVSQGLNEDDIDVLADIWWWLSQGASTIQDFSDGRSGLVGLLTYLDNIQDNIYRYVTSISRISENSFDYRKTREDALANAKFLFGALWENGSIDPVLVEKLVDARTAAQELCYNLSETALASFSTSTEPEVLFEGFKDRIRQLIKTETQLGDALVE